MKQYMRMMFFIIVLGSIVSLLIGMDMFTKDRIVKNQEALVKSSILDAYAIGYNFNTIFDVFEENVTVIEVDGTTFYVDNNTNHVSYIFDGSGVWGPIKAIMTLDADFKTIMSITILEQGETPGLGGVLAEKPYLSTFKNTVLSDSTPYIIIRHQSGDNLPNEVDAITGGTRTSEAFMKMINQTYPVVKTLWESRGA